MISEISHVIYVDVGLSTSIEMMGIFNGWALIILLIDAKRPHIPFPEENISSLLFH